MLIIAEISFFYLAKLHFGAVFWLEVIEAVMLYSPTPGCACAFSITLSKVVFPLEEAMLYFGIFLSNGSGVYSEGPGMGLLAAFRYNSALDLPVRAVGIKQPGALGKVFMLADIVSY